MGNPDRQDDESRVNWDATSHQQLWEWFSQPQLQEMQGWMDAWTDKVAAHFQAAADEVDQALRAAGAHWEGSAAQAMQDASSPLAEHALLAKDAATQAGFTTLSQFMYAKNTATALPEPQPAPDQITLIEAASGYVPQYLQDVAEYEAAANEAEARARDLVRSYDTAADDAVGGLPRFEQAPSSAVSRAEPTTTSFIEVDGNEPRQAGPDSRRDTGPDTPGPGSPGPGDPTEPSGPTSVTPPPEDTTSGQSVTPATSGPQGNTPLTPGLSGAGDGVAQRPPAVPFTGLVAPGPGGQGSGMPRGTIAGPGGPGTGGQPPGGRGGAVAPGPGSGGVRGAPVTEGPVAARAGTAASTGRGAGGMGLAPVGASRGNGDEDTERTSPEYLHDYHDDFWDDTPPVAPAVIGDEDDDE